ncbi:MAG: GntR family transcriptional regulator [Gammaproteobacteria bacterium]
MREKPDSNHHTPRTAAFVRRYATAPDPSMPKHVALRGALLAAISDGFWEPGSKLPTESELAQASPFSLGTVQRALRSLAEEGYVERRRGYGTVLPDRPRQLDQPWHCRFLGDDGQSFLPVFTVVLSRTVRRHHGPWSAPLHQGRESVIQIDRRMEINDEFVVYSKFYVRADRVPEFLDAPPNTLFGANLKTLIARAIGRPLTAMKQRLVQVELPPPVCREIAVQEHTVGVLVQATAYAGKDFPVYYQELYIPPTSRQLYMESKGFP